MSPAKQEKDTGTEQGPKEEETLQERSARLEAEAAQGSYDPLAPEPEPSPEENIAENPEASDRVTALEKELDATKDHMLRALAEAENARKRAQKEREDASRYAISAFARDLLDVADNLRRALDAVPEDLSESDVRVKNLLEGIEATEREMLRSFEKHNIQKLEPLDEVFDPNFHEVMFEAPGTGKPAGTIIEVIDTGYILNDRLLRPARVGVAKDDGQDGGSSGPDTPSTDPGSQIDTEA